MKILFIAPLPPPITGHSLVSNTLCDHLQASHQLDIVDLRKDSFKDGLDSFKRVREVMQIKFQVFIKSRGVDSIYLTISESLAGNIKDLFLYIACWGKLSKTYIHLHGGTIKKQLWDSHPILFAINKYFIKKLGGVIISGNSHLEIFSEIVSISKIHIIPNFAPSTLFIEESFVKAKFKDLEQINILYMSNLKKKKGYNELLKAFQLLDPQFQNKIKINYAGAFESEQLKNGFLLSISDIENIDYHGIVSEEQKKDLFKNAHIFCLPTTYFEGQPLSILEAYATGCVVITTGQLGIRDIFEDKINGYEISDNLSVSICNLLTQLISNQTNMETMGLLNYSIAQKDYNLDKFNSSMNDVLLQ